MSVKQVILVRKDLNMPTGKLAAQVAHASLDAYIVAKQICDLAELIEWNESGKTKIVLEVPDLKELLDLRDKAKTLFDLPTSLIEDEGRTVFTEYTITCGAIGPADSVLINQITGHLLTYK